MNVARVNQASGITPANQSYQDNHEKTLQKQIANLQEKVKSIAYDREMSEEEKFDEKKKLQEKMQSLNTELKQYELQKQQETAKQQDGGKKTVEGASPNSGSVSGVSSSNDGRRQTDETEKKDSDRDNTSSGVILSISSTNDQLANMHKIRKNLEGRMRIAETDEERSDLQKRINSVSKNMGEKIRKISDTITDNLKDEEKRKNKIEKIQKEHADCK